MMLYVNKNRIIIVSILLISTIFITTLSYTHIFGDQTSIQDIYSVIKDFKLSSNSKVEDKPIGIYTNNKDPKVIAKQEIELKVNELLKSKLEDELKYEREELKKESTKLKQEQNIVKEKSKQLQGKIDDQLKSFKFENHRFLSGSPEYSSVELTISSADNSKIKAINPKKNENIIMASINGAFGVDRSFEDFLKVIDSIKLDRSKTTLAFLVSGQELLEKTTKYYQEMFEKAVKSETVEEIDQYYSKIVLVNAPFLERLIDFKGDRHKMDVQAKRRKVLGQLRNFLLTSSLSNEKYSLFIDSDMVEIHKDLFKIFVESNKDIAVGRIDQKNSQGNIFGADYDKNTWVLGEYDPETVEIGPRVRLLEISQNKEKYKVTSEIDSSLEVDAVGGAVLLAKTEVFRQGATFPPYYVVGTKWGKGQGYDGIETEGLCYQAKSIGYKCWGFPNLISYHSFNP